MATPVIIKILTDTTGSDSDLNNLGNRFQQLGDRLTQIGTKMTVAITAPLVAFGKSAIDAASAMNEMEDLTRDAFGKNANSIIAWSETLVDRFGVGKDEALDFASKTKLMFDSWNVPASTSEEIIKNLVTRAGDLASAFDTDVATATQAMGAAFRGEYDTLEQFGISIRASEVQTRALEIAMADGRTEITRSDEALATYQLIMEASEGVAGNFAKTQDSLANQTRKAQERFQELQRELGTHLLPIMSDVMEEAINMLEIFRDLPDEVQQNIIKFAALAAAAGPVVVVMGNVVKALGFLVNHPVIAALAAIAAGVTYAYREFEPFRNLVDAAWQAIQRFFNEASGGRGVMDVLRDVVAALRPVFNNLADAARGVANWFGNVWDAARPLRDVIGALWDVFFELGRTLVRDIVSAFRGIARESGILWDAFLDAYRWMKNTFAPVWEFLADTIIFAVRSFTDVVLASFAFILRSAANIAEAFGLHGLADSLRNAADKVDAFKDDINSKLDQVKKNVDIYFQGHDEVSPTIDQITQNIRGLQAEIEGMYGAPTLDPSGPPRVGLPGGGSGGISVYGDGGTVGGPTGAPQLVLAHGGETILPTHKAGVSLEGIAQQIVAGMQDSQPSSRTSNFGPITVMSNNPDDMMYQLNERSRLRNLITGGG